MSDPLVSVIIPAYNVERWVAETLENAFTQTWRPIEIILVDDGSTDGTLQIARQYESRGLKIVTQENRGLSGARNSGLKIATGEFVQFLDADDLLSADKIQRQIEMLQTSPPGTLALSRWGRFKLDVTQAHFRPSPLWRDFNPRDYLSLVCRLGGVAPVHNWLTPHHIILAAGPFNEEIRVTEDVEFFTRAVLTSAGIRFCQEGCCYYRSFHAKTLSKLRDQDASESLLRSAQLVESSILRADSSAEMRRACADNYQNVIYKLPVKHRSLIQKAEKKVAELGGSDVRPILGKRGRWLARIVGWRTVQWLRVRLWTWGIYLGKSELISE